MQILDDKKRYQATYDEKTTMTERYQATYDEKDPYANSYYNSYSYEKHPSYNNGYDKSSYFMDSYGDRDKKHKDKVLDYECRTGPFEGFFVSSVEFCDAKHKKFDDRKNHR